jgi:hypothetical protein
MHVRVLVVLSLNHADAATSAFARNQPATIASPLEKRAVQFDHTRADSPSAPSVEPPPRAGVLRPVNRDYR